MDIISCFRYLVSCTDFFLNVYESGSLRIWIWRTLLSYRNSHRIHLELESYPKDIYNNWFEIKLNKFKILLDIRIYKINEQVPDIYEKY